MSKKKGIVAEMVTMTTNKSNKKFPGKSEDGDAAISMSKNGDIILRIHAKPNAKTTRIIGKQQFDEIELAIASPPRDGQANETLINAIMDILELRKNEITFDKGVRSRSKVIRLTTKCITLEEVREKLEKMASRSDNRDFIASLLFMKPRN
ncbi:hypothetical protein DINM_003571 [Dirofilaria immitis]|nr:hypothetical protein [Dirofilaria immitis]